MSVRPLGSLEKHYAARQFLGAHVTVVVTASYRAPHLNDAALYSVFSLVLERLVARHPALATYVEGGGTASPRFVRLESIEVRDVLQLRNIEATPLVQVLEELHDQKWGAKRPLWKLVVMAGHSPGTPIHVAFVHNHVIGDGLSGMAFQRCLARELGELGNQVPHNPPRSIVVEDCPLVEPVDKLLAFSLSWSFMARAIALELGPRWLVGSRLPGWAGQPYKTLQDCPFRSRLRLVTIPCEQVRTILAKSREHGVTVTSAITAAIARAVALWLRRPTSLVGATPYSLRRETRTSLNEIVSQVSTVAVTYPEELVASLRATGDGTVFWETARYFQRHMREEVHKCPKDNVLGLLAYVPDQVKMLENKCGNPREASWELSNLGVIEPRPSKDWRLEDVTFTQGALPFGAAFSVNCATVADGPMTLTVSWQESVVEKSLVDAVESGLKHLSQAN